MKKSFLATLALAALPTLCSAQSIVKSSNLWSNLEALEPSGNLRTEKIKFTTDTVIGVVTYKLVKRSTDESGVTWRSYGYIREDPQKKVYYKLNPADPEKILYDMGMNINDSALVFGVFTFGNTVYLDSMIYHVLSADSMLIGNTYRRQLHMGVWNGRSIFEIGQWVDSTGSLNGILHNQNLKVGCDSYALLCFEEDEVLKYHNPAFSKCYVVTGTEDAGITGTRVSVFPNPVTRISEIRISGMNENTEFEIIFYNLQGENILVKKGGGETRISKGELTPGLYLYKVTTNNATLASGKIVIL
jgi:hypothetical protein